MSDENSPLDLMHEKVVLKKYGRLFVDRELQEARRDGLIDFHDLRKGPHYTDRQIMAYLNSKVKPACLQNNAKLDPAKPTPGVGSDKKRGTSSSENTGSGGSPAPRLSSITGMTTKLEERAAELLDSET